MPNVQNPGAHLSQTKIQAKPQVTSTVPAHQNANPIQVLQNQLAQSNNPKISQAQFEEWKGHALQDQKLDRHEARFLMDQMGAGRFEADAIPGVTALLAKGFNSLTPNPIAAIGGNKITDIHRVDSSFSLDSAKQITDENGIDEIYFRPVNAKGELEGDLYVAYGSPEAKGSLNLDHVKPGYVGRMGDQKIKVVHINNETNTLMEGAKAPWISAGHTLRDAGQTGIAKGIAEVATTVTALFIGKTVVENGVKTISEKGATTVAGTVAGAAANPVAGVVAAPALVTLAESAAAPVAEAAAVKSLPTVVQEAKTLGSTLGESVKSSLRSVAIGAAVAGAVVGTVVTIGSAISMVKSRYDHRDYTTLDMVTGNY